ncbi:MAG TPA: hypothetical protein VF471_01130 [Pseudoxanthomonas sp.]
MKPIALVFAALIGLAALPVLAQQLQQPTVPAIKPATPPSDSGIGPTLKQAQPTSTPKVASDPNQRPQAPAAIPSTGPAREVPTESRASPARKQPTNVLDANGKPVNGMIQVAPNRVYDPATGRYHWTETSGQQQKLLD